jgi:hypothetical protein
VYYSQEYTLEELESIPAIEQTTLRLMEEEWLQTLNALRLTGRIL